MQFLPFNIKKKKLPYKMPVDKSQKVFILFYFISLFLSVKLPVESVKILLLTLRNQSFCVRSGWMWE